jgi:hypothetical protein
VLPYLTAVWFSLVCSVGYFFNRDASEDMFFDKGGNIFAGSPGCGSYGCDSSRLLRMESTQASPPLPSRAERQPLFPRFDFVLEMNASRPFFVQAFNIYVIAEA